MGLFSGFFDLFTSDTMDSSTTDIEMTEINPANGMPMVGAVDVEGNPYGTDSDSMNDFMSDSTSGFDDDTFSSFDDDTFSSFDDSFSSFDDNF